MKLITANKLIKSVLLSFSSFIILTSPSHSFANELVESKKVIFDDLAKAEEDFIYDNYFTIQQPPTTENVSLMRFVDHPQKFPMPSEPYNREKHFGGWLHFANDNSCLDTRGLVLQRDSKTEVEINSSCRVNSGSWHDDYTAKTYKLASEVQIDHVVPLKNAYMTGAYEWSDAKKCLYANYMGNTYHLKPVFGSENLRKGDRSPREYIPPNTAYTCEYLKIWMKIKYIWNLRFTPKEKTRIQEIAAENHCSPQTFVMTQAEIQEQERFQRENENICLQNAVIAF